MKLQLQQTDAFEEPQETAFVEVIIPLFLDKPFTYRVPRHLTNQLAFGKRVLVPFGRRHLYTGIITKIHSIPPADYQAKYVIDLLDEFPIIHEKHYQFWQWISDYYMCTIGEAMDCALPAGMKVKSETSISLHPAFTLDSVALTDKEHHIVEALDSNSELKISAIMDLLKIKTVMPTIRSLHDKGVIILSEELKGGYKPKIIKVIELNAEYKKEKNLQAAFQVLEQKKQTQKQANFLLTFLSLSKEKPMVLKSELLKEANSGTSVLSSLIKKEILLEREYEVDRINFENNKKEEFELTEIQKACFIEIKGHFESKTVSLLHGITGSGKTHIYAKLIEQYLAVGKQVLYLVPEIALTTQLISRLMKFFGAEMGLYHSRMSENERSEMWHRVLSGDIKLIVGARSSLFLPFTNLGLIIIDEEHESSYKQMEPAPRYHARDAAVYLAVKMGAKVLMGTATPSLESYYNARNGKYGLAELTARHRDIQPPVIEIVDMKEMHFKKMMKSKLSLPLYTAIKIALKGNHQTILFQNRRGFASIIECGNCTWIPQCKNCDITLTYHKFKRSLNCHYCGYHIPVPQKCSVCGSSDLNMKGYGTERIEDELEMLFPEADCRRMDLDTTRKKNAFDQIIRSMEMGQTDILVGTQMVVKGLDFDRVKVVGILNADALMNFPDFRSLERSFQMMVQVAGRAGRKDHQGYVLIQSFHPQHYIFDQVKKHGYKEFYLAESQQRRAFNYPPFTRLTKLILRHKELEKVIATSNYLANGLLKVFGTKRILGPESPGVGRVRNKYIKHIFIKTENDPKQLQHMRLTLQNSLTHVKSLPEHRSVELLVDIDPL